jgi:hypothetical protein
MIQYSSLNGLSANWMLHSPTIFSARMTFNEVSRNLKYSLDVATNV